MNWYKVIGKNRKGEVTHGYKVYRRSPEGEKDT